MATKNQVQIDVKIVDKTAAALQKIQNQINNFASSQEKALSKHLSTKIKINKEESDGIKLEEKKTRTRKSNETLEAIRKEKLKAATIKTDGERATLRKKEHARDEAEFKKKKIESEKLNKDVAFQKEQLRKDSLSSVQLNKINSQVELNKAKTIDILAKDERIAKQNSNKAARIAAREADNAAKISIRQQQNSAKARESMYGRVAGTSATVGTIGGVFSLKKYMEMEQAGMKMRLLFGENVGDNILEQLKDFAKKTAFSLKDTMAMMEGISLGSDSLGINDPQQMVELMKKVSLPILAYVGNKADRNEVSEQLRQTLMKSKANTRQDLMVMQSHGLPIYKILTDYMSMKSGKKMTMNDIKDMYGAEAPSKLIIKALEWVSTTKKIDKAMSERSKSFTQSWDNFRETLDYTSASVGGSIESAFKLTKKLQGLSSGMTDLGTWFVKKGVDKNGKTTEEFSAGGQGLLKGLAAGVGILGGAWLFPKIASKFKALGGATGVGKGLGASAQKLAPLTVAMADYGNIYEEILKNPLDGLKKNFLELAATAVALTTPLGTMAVILKTLHEIGFYSKDNVGKGEYSVKEKTIDKILNYGLSLSANRFEAINTPTSMKAAQEARNMIIDTNLAQSNFDKIKEQNIINLNIQQETIVKGGIEASTKTKSVRDPFRNTIIKQIY